VDAIGHDGKSQVDEVVLRGVQTRFQDTIEWLCPGQRRISDQHVSSDESGCGSDEADEKWK